jgi:esterase
VKGVSAGVSVGPENRLHYLEWGNVAKPPILFLHGGGLNAYTWDMVCLTVRERYHCIALDQRGHGESEWAPDVDYRGQGEASPANVFFRGSDASTGSLPR